MVTTQPATPAKRACDECRTRKTRCDRASPCSRCRVEGLLCRTTTQRSKERKDRIHVTKEYESKMDRMENRLANIEKLLQRLCDSSPSVSTKMTTASSTPSNMDWDAATFDKDPGEKTRAGVVGFRAELIAAKSVVDQTVSRDPNIQHDPQLVAALDALRDIVARTHLEATGPSKSMALERPVIDVHLPAWDQVGPMLKHISIQKPGSFNWTPQQVLADFCVKCRSMFEQKLAGSPTDKLLVYSIMSNACSRSSTSTRGKGADESHILATTFGTLLLQALSDFPLLTLASLEAAEALLNAAATTISMCKPSLTWSLISAVARMCQTLGYNRLAHVDPGADPLFERKVILFWSTYVLDRNTSLRLGRAPSIQDYDIDTPMLQCSDINPFMVPMLDFWVECARLQGKICTKLNGPAAASLTPDERVCLAERLASELLDLYERKMTNDTKSQQEGEESHPNNEFLVAGQSVMLHSTLTMVLYAIPPTHPKSFRALESARKCLRMSLAIRTDHLNQNLYGWMVYCHWIILHTPITPFSGVFGNIIANPLTSRGDLQLLEVFISALRPVTKLSEGIAKFYQLCSTFVQVAQAYTTAKFQESLLHQSISRPATAVQSLQPVIDEFDGHLASLGFFRPSMATNGNESGSASNNPFLAVTMNEQQHSETLAAPSSLDWLSGNASLYGLLDQDLSGLGDGSFGFFGTEAGQN